MKRRICMLLLALCLVFSLTACSSVEDVEAAIDQIGTVTIESGSKIETARMQYEALSSSAQVKVRNADVLIAAIDEYNRLTAAVDACTEAINAIGFVDLDSGYAIENARKYYDALAADKLTDYVAEYAAVLFQSEASFAKLYVENAYAEAETLFQRADYRSAHATMYDAVLRFPGAPMIPQCKILGINSVAELAFSLYVSGDMANAMNYLLEGEAAYGTNERYDEVRNSVEVALAVRRPVNGHVFSNSVGSDYCAFTIYASDTDACVKIQLEDDPKKFVQFYVRANEDATVYVPGGDYIIKYVSGTYWFNDETMFGQWGSYAQADGIFTLNIRRDGGTVYYETQSLTLYAVVDGNTGVVALPSDNF